MKRKWIQIDGRRLAGAIVVVWLLPVVANLLLNATGVRGVGRGPHDTLALPGASP